MLRLLLSTIAILLVLTNSNVAQRKVDQPISDELYEITKSRADAIHRELAELEDHDWAGSYLQGDHHPTVFTIAPKNGFLVTSSLHTFSPSWVNFGRVEFSNGLIRIFPELADDDKGSHVMPRAFVLVRWGAYRHLIPADEMMNFAYDVHSRSGSATVDYFTKASEAEPKGLPDLPPEYTKIMRMEPIDARVVAVEGEVGNYRERAVTINAGHRKNVRKGMSFFLVGRKSIWIKLRVTEVFEDRSLCQVYGMATSLGDSEALWVKKGWRFSSRAPRSYSNM
jgi:hypothetical protein